MGVGGGWRGWGGAHRNMNFGGLFIVYLEGSARAGSSMLVLPTLKMLKPLLRPGTKSDSNIRTELRNKMIVICRKHKVCCSVLSVCKDESLMCIRSGMCT